MEKWLVWIVLAPLVLWGIKIHRDSKNEPQAKSRSRTGNGSIRSAEGWSKMSLYKESVVGVTRTNEDGTSRQKIIKRLREGEEISLVRDPDNRNDPNAIEVYALSKDQIGFIDRLRAEELAPQMDKGYRVEAWVDRILGGGTDRSLGVLIAIQRYKPTKQQVSGRNCASKRTPAKVDTNALSAVAEIAQLLNGRQPFSEQERSRLFDAHFEKSAEAMLETGMSYGEVTGSPGMPSFAQDSDSFRQQLKSIDNDLGEQAKIVRSGVEHYFKTGEIPPPYYAMRVAIILRKAKEYELEARFLDGFSKHFKDGSGVKYGELAERARKARKLASRQSRTH